MRVAKTCIKNLHFSLSTAKVNTYQVVTKIMGSYFLCRELIFVKNIVFIFDLFQFTLKKIYIYLLACKSSFLSLKTNRQKSTVSILLNFLA